MPRLKGLATLANATFALSLVLFAWLVWYFYTGRGGPSELACYLVPIALALQILFTRQNGPLYPWMPAWANHVVVALYLGICAYAFRDENSIIKCGIEAAYREGKLEWKKPISCHLYPIKINKTKTYTMVNYEPRDPMCNPGCALARGFCAGGTEGDS